MSGSNDILVTLKNVAKKLQAAEVYANECDRQHEAALKELQTLRSQYSVVISNLRAQVDLEVTQEMTDAEFMQAKEVPRA